MTQEVKFYIEDLDCPTEANLLKSVLENQDGVKSVVFDYLNHLMIIHLDREQMEVDAVIRLVRTAGMHAKIADQDQAEKLSWWKEHGRMLMMLLSGLCLMGGFVEHWFEEGGVTGWLSGPGGASVPLSAIWWYVAAIVFGGYFVLPKALASLKLKRPDMHLLMVIAVIGAAFIGEWAEAGSVTFLFSVALLLEQWSLSKARRAVALLMELAPQKASVLRDGTVICVAVEEVKMGEKIVVKPGEKIPLDGVVMSGTSAVNQAAITGESLPVDKVVGDGVFAGTLNAEGALEIEVQKESGDTTLAKMVELVRAAGLKRAKSEAWVEKFAKIYTPIMMIFASSCMLIPPLFFGSSWDAWIYRGLVILVIACPCALVISTPVSIVAGLTAAARSGILIKGGVFLEQVGKLQAIAFDKTGTLTEGIPRVQEIVPYNDMSETNVLSIAGALESMSSHPLARAMVEKAKEMQVPIQRPEDVNMITGKGVQGTVNGERYWLGSHRFLHEKNLETPEMHFKAQQLEDAGHSVVALGTDSKVVGLISIADSPRPGIADILQALKSAGIRQTVMLTGDNQPTAQALAQHAGVDRYFAELLPEDKVRMIQQLEQRFGAIGMVGDGVNDAPALASATVSIAMGAVGSDSAIESADIALMSDDLSKLPWLLRHSRRVLSTIQRNIAFALIVKAIFFLLALIGLASLWLAIAADAGTSLVVVSYGLRLIRSK